MAEVKRSWDLLSKEKRNKVTGELVGYFETQHDHKIGLIAAEEILDYFLEKVGKEIYNKALYDTKEMVKVACEDLEVDLDLLQKQ